MCIKKAQDMNTVRNSKNGSKICERKRNVLKRTYYGFETYIIDSHASELKKHFNVLII